MICVFLEETISHKKKRNIWVLRFFCLDVSYNLLEVIAKTYQQHCGF